VLGAADADPGRRPGSEAQLSDGLRAPLTDAVAAGSPTGQSGVHLRQMPPCTIDEGPELRALERDGRAFGVVFIVGVRAGRRLHHRPELVLHLAEARSQPFPPAKEC